MKLTAGRVFGVSLLFLLAFTATTASAQSTTVVISQVYGGGGNSGATYKNDFVELFNLSDSTVNIGGWSVQYASATGTSWNKTDIPANTMLEPGQYFLVQQAAGAGGTVDLPTPDATGTAAMSATAGKVALVNNTTALTVSCPTGASIIDFVGFGTTANCFEGTGRTPAPSNTNAVLRDDGGCTDTDDNSADFTAGAPTPRNTATTKAPCNATTPAISINDVSRAEGHSGTVTFTFTVSLTQPAGVGGVTFDIDTADDTATTADGDYVAKSLDDQTIAEGETSTTFEVTVNGDTKFEADETFFVNLSDISGADAGDTQGVGTITNDDVSPLVIAAPDTAYTENFDTLASTGTSSAMPTGWAFLEADSNANTTYAANDGSSNAGNTYSYGTTSSTERALGALASGSLQSTFGARLLNDTGETIQTLTFEFFVEQWRSGDAGGDRFPFAISLDANSLGDGTWTPVTELDLVSPNTAGGAVARDGNAAENRAAVAHTIAGLAIPDGATFWIRWADVDETGSDDGLAVDEFSILANTTRPLLTVDDVALLEGDSGTTQFTFTIALNRPAPAGGVSFDVATEDGTASASSDYVASSVTGAMIPEGATSTTFAVPVYGDTMSEPDETFLVRVTNVTGTGVIVADATGTGTILTDEVAQVAIHDVQGNGGVSPYNGTYLLIDGIVTGIKSGSGFFVQEPDADADGDPQTSEGIFVFTGSSLPAGAAIGNLVEVAGYVTEFPSASMPHATTELAGSISVDLVAAAQPLPVPVVIGSADGQPGDDLSHYERFEGMRVQADLTVVAPTEGSVAESSATSSSNGVFFGVISGVDRPFREPGIEQTEDVPSDAACPWCIPVFDANPEKLRVDSDAQPGTTALDVAAGQTVTGIVGVLDSGFFDYTILREAGNDPTVTGGSTAAAVRAPVANELLVGSLNVERLFDTTNDPSIGEPVLTTTAFENRLNKLSLGIRNVMRSPAVIGIVEVENEATLDALAAKLDTDSGTTDYEGYVIEGNDVGGIDVGFLVDLNRVTVNSVTQAGKDTMWVNPHTGLQDASPLNDRPPLILEATASRSDASDFDFTVIVNHLRSLNDVELDDDTGRRVRAKRAAQAEFLADLIQTRQTTDPAERILVIGDFNAFEFSDGYTDVIGTIAGAPAPAHQVVEPTDDLVDPNLTNLVHTLDPGARYSYVFDGSAQVLDHALVNAAMLPSVNDFAFAHFNGDFPEVFRNDANRAERIADHDGTVTYLDLGTTLRVAVSDSSALENAGAMTFTVALDAPAPGTVSVAWTTTSGTAIENTDFAASGGTVEFTSGQQFRTVTVPLLDDALFEIDETFLVQLSNPSGVAIADGEAIGTIVNDDNPTTDLTVTIGLDPDPPYRDRPFRATVVVTNGGPLNATGVEVTIVLPNGTTILGNAPAVAGARFGIATDAVTTTQGSCTGSGPVVCTVGALGVGESATITLDLQFPPGSGPFTLSASASADQDDAGAAAASVTITAASVSIPTLDEWMLIALALLLAGVAVARMR